jgi:hypothetical protein
VISAAIFLVTILLDMFVRFDCVIFSYSSLAVVSFKGTCWEWLMVVIMFVTQYFD